MELTGTGKTKTETVLFAFLVALLAVNWLTYPGEFWFNDHMARDVVRAFDWAQLRPPGWWGPEMGHAGGARLPGPFFYWFLAICGKLTGSLVGLAALKNVLSFLCVCAFAFTVRRKYDPWVSLPVLFVFTTAPFFLEQSRTLWNPSLLIPLVCLDYALLNRRKGNEGIFLHALLFLLAIQVHFSALLPFSALTLAYGRRNRRLLLTFLPVLALLSFWVLSFSSPQGGRSIGASGNGRDHLLRARYLLLPTHDLYGGGDPFYFLDELGKATDGRAISVVEFLHRFLGWVLVLGLMPVLAERMLWLRNSERDGEDTLAAILVFSGVVVTYLTFEVAGAVPYRYGLVLFPFQYFLFFFSAARFPRARILVAVFAGLIAVTNVADLWFRRHTMLWSGRSAFARMDVGTLTLSAKVELFERARKENPKTRNPFDCLHGFLAGKLRLDEMNWGLDHRWEAQLVTGASSGTDDSCQRRFIVVDERDPSTKERFRFIPLTAENIPENWPSPRIFPIALNDLEVQADFPGGGVARLLIDTNAPMFHLILKELVINGVKSELSCHPENSYFLVPQVCEFPLPEKGPVRISLSLGTRIPKARLAALELLRFEGPLKEGYDFPDKGKP